MMNEYQINGGTRLIALLGSPVAHSVSPAMHNEGFRLLGLDYSYMAFDVKEDNLKTVVDAFRVMNVRGMNLTMPCKNKMVGLCDRLAPEAELCGAVNTVVIDEGVLTGHSTDGIGFLRSAAEHGFQTPGSRIVLLGAGGAATSILAAAALVGASEIAVFCRRTSAHYDRAAEIAEKLSGRTDCQVEIYDYDDRTLRRKLSGANLLINATKVGMAPETDGCLIPDDSYLPEGLIVGDVIYNPRETKLVKMAKAKGLVAFGGLDMLLFQGAEAFRIWTGQDMPVDAVRAKYF